MKATGTHTSPSGLPQQEPLKLAIIAATNRREKYLRQFMKDVRAQSAPDWIAYVVHDGPNARARRLAEKAATRDPRIRYHELDHHVGNWGHTPRREALRRILAEEPDTDYVWFWDDDDAYSRDSVKTVSAALFYAGLPDLLLVPFDMSPGLKPPEHIPVAELRLGSVMSSNLVMRPALAAEMYDKVLTEVGQRRGGDFALFDKIRTAGTYRICRASIPPPGSRDGHRLFHVLRTKLRIPNIGLAKWQWYRVLKYKLRSKSESSHEVFRQQRPGSD